MTAEPIIATTRRIRICAGCKKPVDIDEPDAIEDFFPTRSFWHSQCEQKAWEESGMGLKKEVEPRG